MNEIGLAQTILCIIDISKISFPKNINILVPVIFLSSFI